MAKKLEELNPGIDDFKVKTEIYYREQEKEVLTSLRAYALGIPIIYTGPTGSGKTTLTQHIAYLLGIGYAELTSRYGKILNTKTKGAKISTLSLLEKKIDSFRDGKGFPLLTLSGQEDLDKDEMVGRPFPIEEKPYWLNGPAKLAAQYGGILYFDEPAEARPDVRTIIHPLSDHRRTLPVEALGQIIDAHESFGFIMSYNPRYMDPRKRFKPSTSQRFIHLPIGYPKEAVELEIVLEKTGIDPVTAKSLIRIAENTRNLADQKTPGIQEGASPREVIHAAELIVGGEDPLQAALASMAYSLTDRPEQIEAIKKFITAQFKGG